MIEDNSRFRSILEHEEIKSWAEGREARPVRNRRFNDQTPEEHIKFRFPGELYPDEEDLSWEEFFDIFDRHGLEFQIEDMADQAVEQGNLYQFRPRRMG